MLRIVSDFVSHWYLNVTDNVNGFVQNNVLDVLRRYCSQSVLSQYSVPSKNSRVIFCIILIGLIWRLKCLDNNADLFVHCSEVESNETT